MARGMAFGGLCVAATLAGCGDSTVIQKNSVSAQTWIAAGTNASSFGVQNDGFTVINFEFDSDELTAEAMLKLAAQAAWIESNPNIRFGVIGHTDLVGALDYNMELGMRRAERVVAALISAGVSEDQLVAQVSQGELDPVVDTEEREAANRRTTTEFLEYIQSNYPVGQDGEQDGVSPIYYSVSDTWNPNVETFDSTQPTEEPNAVETPSDAADPEGSSAQKSDNSDANGKGGNGHDREDKDQKDAHEVAENKKSAKSDSK